MTERWVSNAMHWCEYCKVWMQDTPMAKATHEKGLKHKENVAKKLRDMRKQQEVEKEQKALAAKTMADIERRAKEQYEADKKASEAAEKAALGEWVYDEDSKYYYNAVQRWYYDRASDMYYGGDPPEWASTPKGVPAAALYPGSAADVAAKQPAAAAPRAAAGAGASGSGRLPTGATVVRKVVSVPKHPLADLGGYQMPTVGAIGGAKDLGTVRQSDAKRKREAEAAAAASKSALAKKEITPEEAEAIARREAARQRVQARTLNTFGMG